MAVRRDRIGEEGYNSFGSKMIIVGYRNIRDIDIYFPEYDFTFKHVQYDNFKKGKIKCLYEPRYYGKGYLGEGKYKVKENGKHTDEFKIWHGMLQRCYDPKYKEKHPTYIDCTVCEEWHNFQNFSEWYEENYYEIEGEVMNLDKDILIKKNKIYSPDTCVFVPQSINSLFVKRDINRGNLPIGVHYDKQHKKYKAQCSIGLGKQKNLGRYNTQEEAFKVYKAFKEAHIKKIADDYLEFIPSNLYQAMINYEIEIED